MLSKNKLTLNEQLEFLEYLNLYYTPNQNLYYLIKDYINIISAKKEKIFNEILQNIHDGILFSEIAKKILDKEVYLLFYLAERLNKFEIFNKKAIELLEIKKANQENFVKTMAYPIFLGIFLFGFSILLDNTIIPQVKLLYINFDFMIPKLMQISYVKLELLLLSIVGIIYIVCRLLLKFYPLIILKLPILRTLYLFKLQKNLFLLWQIVIEYNLSLSDLLSEFLKLEMDKLNKYLFSTINLMLKQGKKMTDIAKKVNLNTKYRAIFINQKNTKETVYILNKFVKDINKTEKKVYNKILKFFSNFIFIIIAFFVFYLSYILMQPLTIIIEAL